MAVFLNVMSEEDKNKRIEELHQQKTALLDKHGVFGGGEQVNEQHRTINDELVALGVESEIEHTSKNGTIKKPTGSGPVAGREYWI